jgi:GNAT superfamily N-acetyltransferase
MNIRLCRPEDEDVWIALNREFMSFEIQDDSPWNDTEKTPDNIFQHTFQEALQTPELITLFIMEENEVPVGFANLMTIYSVWAHGKALILDDIYIKEAYQGKGYGRDAMDFIEAHAKTNEYKRLQFQSETTNPKAKEFYEALGYTATDMYFYVKYF